MPRFRLRFQYSLRTMFLAVTLLAISLAGWLAWWQRIQVHEQRLTSKSTSWQRIGFLLDEDSAVASQARLEAMIAERAAALAERQGKVVDWEAIRNLEPNYRLQWDLDKWLFTHERHYREVYEYYRNLDGSHVRHGLATTWSPEGHKLREERWRNGRLHGPWTDWHPDGTVLAEGEYARGEKHGVWRTYFESDARHGRMARKKTEEYDAGIIQRSVAEVGEWRGKPHDAVIVQEFVAGRRVKWTRWDADQRRIESDAEYQGDHLHGKLVRYYDADAVSRVGQPADLPTLPIWEELHFQNGQRHGAAAGWHANGKPLYRGAFEKGLEVGQWQWWDWEGAVEFSGEFRDGRLVDSRGELFPEIQVQGITTESSKQQIRQALDGLGGADFNELPLADVARYYANLSNCLMHVNEKAFRAEGRSSDEIQVSCELGVCRWPEKGLPGGVTLRATLQRVLAPLDLALVIRHDAIQITTRKDTREWRDRSGVHQLFRTSTKKVADELQEPSSGQFNENSLKDVCEYFSVLHGIPIRVDPASSEDVQHLGISMDHGINQCTLAAVLARICDQYDLTCVDTGKEILVRRVGK